MPDIGPNFEDNIAFINTEIAKRRNLWNMTSIQWMDYDDVSQIIRIHVYEKWHQYDKAKPLGPWLNKVIAHQIKNIVRNIYGNYVRPCIAGSGCAAAEGENLCKIYGSQCSDCPLYAAWEKSKKKAYEVKIPLPIEHYLNGPDTGYEDQQDIDSVASKIHSKMKTILKQSEWSVYKALFIDHLPEQEVALKMGYRSTQKNHHPGYKQLRNVRKSIMDKVKRALANDEVDIL